MTRHVRAPVRVNGTDVVVDALAVSRLTRLAQQDEVWPLLELRTAFLARVGDSRWADLESCPWCLSVWVGAGVVYARHRWPQSWSLIARVLASSAVAGHLAQLAEH